MKKLVYAGLAVALGALTTTFVSPATAAGPPQGRKCGFNSATDVTTEPGVQTGQINGGPLVSTDGTAGTIVCTIKVNDNSHLPGGSGYGGITGVATILPPQPFSYNATALDQVSMCTSYIDNNGDTWYWSSGTLPTDGGWGQDPNASCSEATSVDPNPQACPFLLYLDDALGTGGTLSETWQDCGPYSPIDLPDPL